MLANKNCMIHNKLILMDEHRGEMFVADKIRGTGVRVNMKYHSSSLCEVMESFDGIPVHVNDNCPEVIQFRAKM